MELEQLIKALNDTQVTDPKTNDIVGIKVYVLLMQNNLEGAVEYVKNFFCCDDDVARKAVEDFKDKMDAAHRNEPTLPTTSIQNADKIGSENKYGIYAVISIIITIMTFIKLSNQEQGSLPSKIYAVLAIILIMIDIIFLIKLWCNIPTVNIQYINNPWLIKCPTCSSTNVKKISGTAKVAGAVAFGIFSKTARSQFQCNNCGYKW